MKSRDDNICSLLPVSDGRHKALKKLLPELHAAWNLAGWVGLLNSAFASQQKLLILKLTNCLHGIDMCILSLWRRA
jgi:hypothetical protein